ncbi:hypothetical protein ACQKMN_14590 [Ureibacillus composti]
MSTYLARISEVSSVIVYGGEVRDNGKIFRYCTLGGLNRHE